MATLARLANTPSISSTFDLHPSYLAPILHRLWSWPNDRGSSGLGCLGCFPCFFGAQSHALAISNTHPKSLDIHEKSDGADPVFLNLPLQQSRVGYLLPLRLA